MLCTVRTTHLDDFSISHRLNTDKRLTRTATVDPFTRVLMTFSIYYAVTFHLPIHVAGNPQMLKLCLVRGN